MSRESFLEAARARIKRPSTWSRKDRLLLARECAHNPDACQALTRVALAARLHMTAARLNQILSLLRLVPKIRREILNPKPAAGKRLTERALRPLLEPNDPEVQIERFQKLLADRRSNYRK